MKNKAIQTDHGAAGFDADAPVDTPRRSRAALILLSALLFFGIPSDVDARQGWYPAAGLIWATPTDSAVSDLYAPGPGVMAAMGYDLLDLVRLELRLDWFRQTAHPLPQFAEHAESRLVLTPFSLEGHLRLHRGILTPYLLAGPSLVFSKERFRYTLLGRDREALGRRTDLGAVFGGGIELRRGRARGRLTLRAMITGGNREILRATGRTDPRSESASASFWTLGFEIQPW